MSFIFTSNPGRYVKHYVITKMKKKITTTTQVKKFAHTNIQEKLLSNITLFSSSFFAPQQIRAIKVILDMLFKSSDPASVVHRVKRFQCLIPFSFYQKNCSPSILTC